METPRRSLWHHGATAVIQRVCFCLTLDSWTRGVILTRTQTKWGALINPVSHPERRGSNGVICISEEWRKTHLSKASLAHSPIQITHTSPCVHPDEIPATEVNVFTRGQFKVVFTVDLLSVKASGGGLVLHRYSSCGLDSSPLEQIDLTLTSCYAGEMTGKGYLRLG